MRRAWRAHGINARSGKHQVTGANGLSHRRAEGASTFVLLKGIPTSFPFSFFFWHTAHLIIPFSFENISFFSNFFSSLSRLVTLVVLENGVLGAWMKNIYTISMLPEAVLQL